MAVTSPTLDPVEPVWLDRAVRRSSSLPRWASVTVLAVTLGLGWVVVYTTGGTHLSTPHLFYLPIMAATLPFGARGSIPTALVATVLCGPLMPLVTETGEPQQPASWIVRGAMFVVVASLAALALGLRERAYERQLTLELRQTIGPGHAPGALEPELLQRVDDVVDGRLFRPVYQPIYALGDGRLVAVEALTRFEPEPYRSPDLWFAAARSVGRGTELEILAVEAALEGARDLPPEIELSVNASPATLADERLHALLAAAGRPLVMEITEHAVVEDYPVLEGSVQALRALGVKIAVDDAGAGFASLRHIVHLAPDTIKLDMSLTQHLAASPLRRALAVSLVEFAQQTGAALVVEGLEDVADLQAWTGLGAHAAQGYLVGRPGPLPPPVVNPLITALHHPRRGDHTHRDQPAPARRG
ncbi:EAL domain-containing protein [Actinotalea solisilvae]|uniref:EAL domain-containing protein n=1 Tax=Actinotalea solisilvae TaxID=2072922 RepID=UPI0018F151A4|nr:EAL domain-containing protein [Actinotalea solisilvae]